MNWSRLFILIALISLVSTGRTTSTVGRFRWSAYYSDEASPEEFRGYGLVVFDPDCHPALQPVAEGGTTILAYLSLGEVEEHRAWFSQVEGMGILFGKNPIWPDSYYVDPRDPDGQTSLPVDWRRRSWPKDFKASFWTRWTIRWNWNGAIPKGAGG